MLVIQNNKTYKVVESNWKTYKALLTQQGENAPVARVLNQDEADYLGDIVWSRESAGLYKGEIIGGFDDNLVMSSILPNSLPSDINEGYVLNLAAGSLYLTSTQDGLIDSAISKIPIEIKVRQRGAAPILLSAETNEVGDKVILTFNKKMSGYLLYESITLDGDPMPAVEGVLSVLENIVEITHTRNTPPPTVSCLFAESFDYGLLEPFENLPVVNKVI